MRISVIIARHMRCENRRSEPTMFSTILSSFFCFPLLFQITGMNKLPMVSATDRHIAKQIVSEQMQKSSPGIEHGTASLLLMRSTTRPSTLKIFQNLKSLKPFESTSGLSCDSIDPRMTNLPDKQGIGEKVSTNVRNVTKQAARNHKGCFQGSKKSRRISVPRSCAELQYEISDGGS
jgi:hypothetical protein